MFSKSFRVLLYVYMLSHFTGLCHNALAFQVSAPSPTNLAPNASNVNTNVGASNNADGFATSTPVMTFTDANSGQPYGRYVITEPVPIVAYSYQPVKERVFVPRTVTEPKTMTVTQYVPIQSYQLQLRNVTSWNPFAAPQQVWQYVPIVQYQPNYLQVTQPVTYQKYEEQEITKMIPVLTSQSQQVPRFVDRPLGQTSGSNVIASNVNVNNGNVYQQAALIAQANRNAPRFPTRPMDFPTNSGYTQGPYQGTLAQAPAAYYPNPAYNPASYYATNHIAAGAVGAPTPVIPNSNIASSNNLVIPAVPLQPNMQRGPNAMAGYNGYGQNGNPNYQPNQPNPYTNTASRPLFTWPTFASGTGSVFGKSLFSNNRNTNYVATNSSASQPYVWGNSNPSGLSFRPNTSSYATPQQSWGMTPGNSYRDPMQGGMPATVLR